ncbi:tubulin polyglutamylase TTLL13 [Thecamonas trahens ATCC 50062]|uniref:Tubulin polyglutamylase TTLL13 n=1 Tax=Thecamonas trahens ATCC 50062 TaxID=461836 RepID=A0A0L0DV92_THETB|nr:tubulin polyglutamylase TTLL13 [Thecamonas trahens ATCC 50062]KNC56135.1 tubulin polyglutamylase TTLL13 [Thecamonas trahens ATCC 50062]|eukprot:XP_013761174.1 tubulin polyglutamylase TTLL13 [Thecamonas trahens ATCC 50062]
MADESSASASTCTDTSSEYEEYTESDEGSTLVSVYAYSYEYESDDSDIGHTSPAAVRHAASSARPGARRAAIQNLAKSSRTGGRGSGSGSGRGRGGGPASTAVTTTGSRRSGKGKKLLTEVSGMMTKMDTSAKRLQSSSKSRRLKSRADAVAANNRGTRTRLSKSAKAVNVCVQQCKYEVVRACVAELGWHVQESNAAREWDVYWIDSTAPLQILSTMKPFQRINHFPGMHEICRKDSLARNLTRMQRKFPDAFTFFPKTWILPADYGDFKAHFRKRSAKPLICKPENSAQGKGIFLTHTGDEIGAFDHYVAQVYVNNPLLIDGYKFDLRIYVLVTSADPLRIFIYDDGLVRLCTEKYSQPTSKSLGSAFQHLTNYSVNKKNTNFSAGDGSDGAKRSIKVQNAEWAAAGIDVPALWASIEDAIIKTLITAQPTLAHTYATVFTSSAPTATPFQCFEILGFDIMIDAALKPWILEVNHSPSFGTDAEIDRNVKSGVIAEALALLNLDPKAKSRFHKAHRAAVQDRLTAPNRAGSTAPTDELAGAAAAAEATPSPGSRPVAATAGADGEASSSARQSPEFWEAQTAYEDSVLSGYKRIYPTPDDDAMAVYAPYFVNTSTLYSETSASAKRREHALAQREAAEAERLKAAAIKARFSGRAKAAQEMLAAKLSKGSMSVRRSRPPPVPKEESDSGETDGLPPPEIDCEGRPMVYDQELFDILAKIPGVPIAAELERKRVKEKRRRDAIVHVSRVRTLFEASITTSLSMPLSWNLLPEARTELHARIKEAAEADARAAASPPHLPHPSDMELKPNSLAGSPERGPRSDLAMQAAAAAAAEAAAASTAARTASLAALLAATKENEPAPSLPAKAPPARVARFNENSYLKTSRRRPPQLASSRLRPARGPGSSAGAPPGKHALVPDAAPSAGLGLFVAGTSVSGR